MKKLESWILLITIVILSVGKFDPSNYSYDAVTLPKSDLREWLEINKNIIIFFNILILVLIKLKNNQLKLKAGNIFLLYMALNITYVIKAIGSGELESFYLSIQTTTLLLMLYLVLTEYLGSELQKRELLKILKISVMILWIFISLEYLRYGYDSITWAGRLIGVSSNANHLGSYFLFYIILILSLEKKWHKQSGFYIFNNMIVLLLAVCGVLASESRSAIITLILIVGVWCVMIVYEGNRDSVDKRILLTAIIVGGALIIFPAVFSYDLFGDSNRGEAWERLQQSFLDNPILGAPLQNGNPAGGESMYLGVLSAYGVIGGLIFLSFVFALLRSAILSDKSQYLISVCFLSVGVTEGIIFARTNFTALFILSMIVLLEYGKKRRG